MSDSKSRNDQALWQSRLVATEALARKALQKEKEGALNASYDLCLEAIRSYLWLIRNTEKESTKKELKEASTKLLRRAESIKRNKKDIQPKPVSRLDECRPEDGGRQKTRAQCATSTVEQSSVLENCGSIAGRFFRPWSSDALADVPQGQPYSDSAGHFILAKDQEERLNAFKRVTELAEKPCILSPTASARHIWQNCVTDCTVVTALISCIQHSTRFQSSLCSALLHPHGQQGQSIISQNGKYAARLTINGTWRTIEIDDYLPVDSENTLLCAHMLPPNDFWASLLEKAFVKVHGGYSIKGSDPAADVYAFTGWVPEVLPLRSSSFREEQTWRRLEKGFNAGKCLICLGSGSANVKLSSGKTLASHHAFAVIDMRDTDNGDRTLEVVDPWTARSQSSSNPERQPNTFRLTWQEMCTSLHSIYCNWDPQHFEDMHIIHAQCTVEDPLQLLVHLGPSPGIEQDEIWIHLSKHVRKGSREEYLNVSAREERSHTHSDPSATSASNDYINSPHILLKYRPERGQARLAINVSKIGPSNEISFTLALYATCPLYITDMSVTLPEVHRLEGRWIGASAGGNPSHASYVNNPQYLLNIPATPGPLSIHIDLRTASSSPVNAKLFRAPGQTGSRLAQYETGKVAAESGAYSHRSASFVARDLPAGIYVLVPSSYNAGVDSDFTLVVRSNIPLQPLTLLANEDSGKFTKMVHGKLDCGRANKQFGGSCYAQNPHYIVRTKQVNWISVRLRETSTTGSPLNASLFSSRDYESIVSSTGKYASYVSGVTSGPSKLRPSTDYVMVISSAETSHNSAEISYELQVLSDHPCEVVLST